MKKRFLFILASTVCATPLTAGAQEPEATAVAAADPVTAQAVVTETEAPTVLSLDQCIEIALSENPTLKIADMEITRVDYAKIETISQLLPQASFTGSYNRTLAKQTMYMNMDFDFGSLGGGGAAGGDGEGTDPQPSRASRAGGGDGGIKVGLDNSYSVGFMVSMPVIAPQLWASLKLSDSQILATVEQARSSKLNLVNGIKNAYYALMLAHDSKKVIQESYDMAAFTHELYTKKHALGAASDYEVLRTSVAMKNIEPQLIQADLAIKQARLQLLIMMGIDANFEFEVDGSLEQYEKSMYGDVLSQGTDYSNNTQLVMNDIQTQQLAQALKVQKASLYPTVAASFNYNWTSMSNGSPFKGFRWNPYSMAGLTLNVPLFTGGQRYSRIKQAQVQLDEMQWQRENLERTVAMQVNLAVDNINLNVQQIASCTENVGQAERAHEIMEKSFNIGAASYLDLRDSELALTQSRLAYYQAIYNYLVAQSDLQLLLGKGVDRE